MGYEDQDYIIRMAKQTGEVLGGMLGKKDAEEILSFGEEQKNSELLANQGLLRKAVKADIPELMQIFDEAKTYLKEQGSPQWQNGQGPTEEVILKDIQKEASYVLVENETILGSFALIEGIDPVYEAIDGSWEGESRYVSIHRVAINQKQRSKGLGIRLVQHAVKQARKIGYQDIRIDTYPKNYPMLRVIDKLGFSYRGMVHFPIQDGERKAFQLLQ
ncbi:N-acetyltransferase [Enterococcus florum]|uniref:N-acetyltransferase n=1 Tax=Enterococcus florum TaxID=2480627 RepID=A0A4P5PCB7_9ENTE|nr:GNAT family N-acetyltransferase [Enterococcus florum]GCF95875.1 N-acetyltransferase [Enterococcus florum]